MQTERNFSDWPDGLLATFISRNVCIETVKQKFNERTGQTGTLLFAQSIRHIRAFTRAAQGRPALARKISKIFPPPLPFQPTSETRNAAYILSDVPHTFARVIRANRQIITYFEII